MGRNSQSGFSLVELVIVIVILGLLAATAIPRFLNVTEDAQDASVDGVAGGLATAVGFVRAQWEVDGRAGSSVVLDGANVFLDPRFGYPTGATSASTSATGMSNAECQEVFETVLQNAPRIVQFNANAQNQRYTARVLANVVGDVIDLDGNTVTGVDLCVYHQVATLVLGTNGVPTPTPDLTTASANGITYNPGTGTVASFTNQ
ncbi:type II secretion system protein [Shewanella gelidii]|uniref:MSHA biogenesis protein MshB n=1 Tax=Shewanella gelidii TaxID=1642821 RepID=A0A917NC89_9GAMM|nr:type II secretion system protein [Shewanella gelidii]MCL1098755.1 type II secretion system GspH family protein [Shewanella gelidii]GGI87848.1 MSHA biogenesis protein MshB [Shewanella gelidii]